MRLGRSVDAQTSRECKMLGSYGLTDGQTDKQVYHVAQIVKFENMIYDSSGICRGREGKETGGDMACIIGLT